MTIVELLAEVGADRLAYQKLDECLLGAERRKRGVDITFGTTAVTVDELSNETGAFGFIVWVPRDAVERVQALIDKGKERER